MTEQIIRKLIEVEIRLGFLTVPTKNKQLFPNNKEKIESMLNGDRKSLLYNPEHRRIFGLTSWFKENKADVGDLVVITIKEGCYIFILKKQEIKEENKQEEEAKESINLSGLSSQAKGDIVEDRIKELIILHGLGSLNVYKPVIDIDGVDLIVAKKGHFHPLFIQSKGRYNLHKDKQIILRVRVNTFTPHENYYVVGAFFNPSTLELDEYILLIPSKEIKENAVVVKSNNGELYSIVSSLKKDSNTKWSKFLVKKSDLAKVLIEKFEEMNKYIK